MFLGLSTWCWRAEVAKIEEWITILFHKNGWHQQTNATIRRKNLITSTQQGLAKPLGPCFWLQRDGGLQVDDDLSATRKRLVLVFFFGFYAVNPSTKRMWTPKASPKKHQKQSKFVKKVIEIYIKFLQIPLFSDHFAPFRSLRAGFLASSVLSLVSTLDFCSWRRLDTTWNKNHFVSHCWGIPHQWHPWHHSITIHHPTLSSWDSTSQMYIPLISHFRNHLQPATLGVCPDLSLCC